MRVSSVCPRVFFESRTEWVIWLTEEELVKISLSASSFMFLANSMRIVFPSASLIENIRSKLTPNSGLTRNAKKWIRSGQLAVQWPMLRLIHTCCIWCHLCGRWLHWCREIEKLLSLSWHSLLWNPQTAAASVSEPLERLYDCKLRECTTWKNPKLQLYSRNLRSLSLYKIGHRSRNNRRNHFKIRSSWGWGQRTCHLVRQSKVKSCLNLLLDFCLKVKWGGPLIFLELNLHLCTWLGIT